MIDHAESTSSIRDIVTVSGADAAAYLQTQLTQDIVGLDIDESAFACLLTPKSEIIALMEVVRTGVDEYLLEMEQGWGDVVRGTIDEFLGRMDISFQQGTRTDPDTDEDARIAAGWPRMGKEIEGSVTPAMAGIVNETVSFDKGCYTGQEFVARVHYRDAEPTKRLVRIEFAESDVVDEGAEITIDETGVGHVTSATAGAALGYVKRGTPIPTDAVVGTVAVRVVSTRAS